MIDIVLQSQLPGAVLPEQTPIPNVPPDHLHGAVDSLVHDRSFRRPSNRDANCVAGPKRVTGELGWIKVCPFRQLLDHTGNIDAGQPPGHVSRDILEHYSHIRMQAKRDAVVTLEDPQAKEQSPTEVVPAKDTVVSGSVHTLVHINRQTRSCNTPCYEISSWFMLRDRSGVICSGH
jgi:hypothetical protein